MPYQSHPQFPCPNIFHDEFKPWSYSFHISIHHPIIIPLPGPGPTTLYSNVFWNIPDLCSSLSMGEVLHPLKAEDNIIILWICMPACLQMRDVGNKYSETDVIKNSPYYVCFSLTSVFIIFIMEFSNIQQLTKCSFLGCCECALGSSRQQIVHLM